MKTDELMKKVTDRMAANLANAGQWSKPWGVIAGGEMPHNAITGRPYSGINTLILATTDYHQTGWLTYKQAQELGGHVRKGEKGEQIIFWKKCEKKTKNEQTGETEKNPYFLMRTYTVFNVEQCENLPANKIKQFKPLPVIAGQAVTLASQLGATVHYGGDKAYFRPSTDSIGMPHLAAFKDQHNFDATLLHELTHWTGGEKRLARKKHKKWGDRTYAFEELIAELGAAMAGAALGIPYEGLQHEKYIASWLKSFDGDTSYLYDAAVMAQKAVDYMIENSTVIAENHSEAA